MPIPLTIDPNDDDALSEALADAWVAAAANDPAILKAARRAAGLLKAPADMTLDELAREQGTDRHTLQRIARKAILRLRFSPMLSHIKPEA
jgi:hypothetical protein